MGYRVKPFTMAVRDNSTQQFVDVGLLTNDLSSTLETEKISVETPRTETTGTRAIEVAYYADQGAAQDPGYIATVVHNYTDAHGLQIDNVGKGTCLNLRQGNNQYRRTDKPADYVGEGAWLSLQHATRGSINVNTNGYTFVNMDKDGTKRPHYIMDMTQDATKIQHFGAGTYYDNNATLDAKFSVMRTYDQPLLMFEQVKDGSNRAARIETGNTVTGKFELKANNSYISLTAPNGVYINSLNKVTGIETATTANRPSSPVNGEMVFDNTLGKPIWWKASASVWVDATGATV